ncbi:DoxX family membrane protein [Bacteroidota bacterium]
MSTNPSLNKPQSVFLVLLRVFIGWHLLYEGVAKLLIPDWSSEAYLLNSKWIFGGLFHGIAQNASALQIADFLNIWGLIIIGLTLLLGLLARYSAITGIVLLSLYYIANPPFIGTDFGIPTEGHYLFINKTLVEIVALGILAVFPSGMYFGMDRFLSYLKKSSDKKEKLEKPASSPEQTGADLDTPAYPRREILRYMAMAPILGAFAWGSWRKFKWNSVNAISGATITVPNISLNDLKAPVTYGQILDKKVSRVIAGGNLIGGWSHSRDLGYVNQLFKAYNTEKKVFETLTLAEKTGINTINLGPGQLPLINKYKRIFDSELQTMCQVHPKKDDIYGDIQNSIDLGVDMIQIQGNCCDFRVRDGEVDVLASAMDYIKEQGYPAGLGAHSVQALIACDEAGIEADFYMKTLHHDKYWSAHPRENRIPFSVDGKRSNNHDEFHDNMFCLFPEETIEFMQKKKIPWIAFKVLAGGAISPEDGFKFAFENGADFICVGMFDWQIVDDVNIANETLNNLGERKREWYG